MAPEKVPTDRLYAPLDRLLPHKEAIESHLKQRFGQLFELKCDLLFYDVTSTYFEGDAERCEIAKRGYSRDSRGDRPQVCIGLGSDRGRIPAGIRGLCGEQARLPDGEKRGGIAGTEARIAQSRLGDGPWNGEQGQPRVPPAARCLVHRRHAEIPAP